MPIAVHQFPCLKDNFGVLVRDPETGAVAAIDAPDGAAVIAAAEAMGWPLTHVLVTHHHADHVQGLPAVKAKFPNVKIIGPAAEADRIAGLDEKVGGGDVVSVGKVKAQVIDTPGHTAGHIIYWFEADGIAFCGDTLFAIGCGRVLETPLAVMWNSLTKVAALPRETTIYCGHEYTEANARFALTVDPANSALKQRAEEVSALRKAGRPTLPTTLAAELATNPFLRAEAPEIQANLGMAGADPAAVFAELRTRKDKF